MSTRKVWRSALADPQITFVIILIQMIDPVTVHGDEKFVLKM